MSGNDEALGVWRLRPRGTEGAMSLWRGCTRLCGGPLVKMLVILFKNMMELKANMVSCFIKVIVDDIFTFNGRMVLDSDVECMFWNVPERILVLVLGGNATRVCK